MKWKKQSCIFEIYILGTSWELEWKFTNMNIQVWKRKATLVGDRGVDLQESDAVDIGSTTLIIDGAISLSGCSHFQTISVMKDQVMNSYSKYMITCKIWM